MMESTTTTTTMTTTATATGATDIPNDPSTKAIWNKLEEEKRRRSEIRNKFLTSPTKSPASGKSEPRERLSSKNMNILNSLPGAPLTTIGSAEGNNVVNDSHIGNNNSSTQKINQSYDNGQLVVSPSSSKHLRTVDNADGNVPAMTL